MAKHKQGRDTKQPARSSAPSSDEESRSSSTEDRAEQVQSRIGSPSDVARKKQKRFGHN